MKIIRNNKYFYITVGVKRILDRIYGKEINPDKITYTVTEDREKQTITLWLKENE
jgi:hypothetical protein